MAKIIPIFLVVIPFLLSHCASGPSADTPLPVLSSPSRAQAWGPPKTTSTKGGYRLTYTNPSNSKERLVIEGSPKPFYHLFYPPNLTGTRTVNGIAVEVNQAQMWQQSLVLNQPVKWYQRTLPSEDYGAIFRSLGAPLKTPSGSAGFYRVEVEGTKNQMQRWLSELRFRQQ